MSELLKDLEGIIAGLAIAPDDARFIWVDVQGKKAQAEISVSNIAARLAELGYVKAVRCAECKRPEHREPGMVWCPLRLGSWMVETDYCSEGERVVAKNATGEEGK